MPLKNLLPLHGISVTLRFTEPAEFTPFHNAAVDAFLRHMLAIGDEYGKYFSIVCPENGRLRYTADDTYRFGVIVQPGGEHHLRILIARLRRLPVTAVVRDKAAPLRDNLQLVEINDLSDGKPISHDTSLTPYTYDQISQHALYLKPTADTPVHLHWRFVAPVRLLRSDHNQYEGEERFIRDAAQLTGPLLIQRTLHTLEQLGYTRALPLQEWTERIALDNADLFWVDTPYFSQGGRTRVLGGLLGDLHLTLPSDVPLLLLELLITAQHLGIGQRRTLGWGKFHIQPTDGAPSPSLGSGLVPLRRAQSLNDLAFRPETLELAILELDQRDPATTEEDNINRLNTALGQIAAGDYHPPALQGVKIPKDDGSQRLLAIAPIWDRVLQKSVALTLTPMLDALYSTASFAYRKGLSRQQVRYEILKAWREGYRWVYESDIEDFFDAVDRSQLLRRLRNVLGDDPLWHNLARWLSRPVVVDGVRVERPRGIPQGSPLSPLLANFILDDFDADLQHHGFRLLRFADDFIILAKTREQAERAHEIVRRSLAELRLQLNRDKTHILHLSEGLRFLGYLFMDDMAIEIGGDSRDGRDIYTADDEPRTLPPWLPSLAERTIKPIGEDDRPEHHIATQEEHGSFIVLTGERHVLTTDNDNLIVRDADNNLAVKMPWEQIYGVLCLGLHSISLPAQHHALRHHIPIHLADRTGTYLGAVTNSRPQQNIYKFWFLQLAACQRADFTLHIARQLIAARIHNQRQSLLRRISTLDNSHQFAPTLAQLRKLYHKAENAQSIQQLLGFEGTAARLWLQSFNPFLPQWAQFERRSKRPPQDPFNALLSLGYTILYSQIDCILQAHGFLTWKGCLHQQSPNHAALASDMMEPYRHIIEQAALSWCRNYAREEDFTREDDTPGIRIHAEARRRYITFVSKRLQQPLGGHDSFHQHIAAQARALRHAIDRLVPGDFTPYRLKHIKRKKT